MKNDVNDIKTILQEEKEQERTKEDLINSLIKYLYNKIDNEIIPERADLLERAFIYFSYNDTRKEICNELAKTQKEYDLLFMNYEKALKQTKSFFNEDIKRINVEQIQEEKEEKQKHTIFGINWLLAILLIPIILFFEVLDNTR